MKIKWNEINIKIATDFVPVLLLTLFVVTY